MDYVHVYEFLIVNLFKYKNNTISLDSGVTIHDTSSRLENVNEPDMYNEKGYSTSV